MSRIKLENVTKDIVNKILNYHFRSNRINDLEKNQ
jgi:hypothetical protein